LISIVVSFVVSALITHINLKGYTQI